MSGYRIENVQRYRGKSVTISTNDMRHSIAVYGETDIECLEYALHFLKNKDKCTQPVQTSINVEINAKAIADLVLKKIKEGMNLADVESMSLEELRRSCRS